MAYLEAIALKAGYAVAACKEQDTQRRRRFARVAESMRQDVDQPRAETCTAFPSPVMNLSPSALKEVQDIMAELLMLVEKAEADFATLSTEEKLSAEELGRTLVARLRQLEVA